ncbi:N6-adenosine-methyltransferase 70 kDa subunit, partial [Ophiophagus hannah]
MAADASTHPNQTWLLPTLPASARKRPSRCTKRKRVRLISIPPPVCTSGSLPHSPLPTSLLAIDGAGHARTMSDTWSSIQAHKKQLDSLRERLQRRRKQEPLDLRNPDLVLSPPFRSDSPVPSSVTPSTAAEPGDLELIEVKRGLLQDDGQPMLVTYADHSKLSAMMGAVAEKKGLAESTKRRAEQEAGISVSAPGVSPMMLASSEPLKEPPKKSRKQASDLDLEIESLLSQQSTKEQQSKKVSQEILELLNTTTAKEQSIVEKFRSRGRAQVQEFCDYGTKEECMKASDAERPCRKLHFRRIINKHTDESLGDCSFLNTCFHMDTCKYVHYEIDACTDLDAPCGRELISGQELAMPQAWICCDIRYLDVSILGKFAVVMADPPWDIHMELPYGTLTDDEMRRLNIPVLQDDGFLFLWVTGRYERVDEIIWVKTNQLQRIIRTGRTGHWLNHGKEHCLVRSTSHKPDEIYGMIERLSPGTRKIELFGRPHNVQPNWITLGNQLDGIHLLDPDVVAQFKQRYPDGIISKPKNM